MSVIWHEFRRHVRLVLTVPFGSSFRIVKTKWAVQSKETFDDKSGGKKHTYNIDLEKAYYNKKTNPTLIYTMGKTDPMDFRGKKGKGESSNLYNTVLKNASAEEILNEGKSKNMMILIGVLVLAIIVIGAYSQYQLGQANDKIIALTREMGGIIANMTKSGGVIIG